MGVLYYFLYDLLSFVILEIDYLYWWRAVRVGAIIVCAATLPLSFDVLTRYLLLHCLVFAPERPGRRPRDFVYTSYRSPEPAPWEPRFL